MAVVPSFIPGGDKVNSFVSNLLDGFEVGIETIRRVDYAAQYLWTMDFISGPKPPAPFDRFFPASDITLQTGISNLQRFEMAQSAFSVSRNSGPKSIDVTFYDDENRSMLTWMQDWINLDIYNNGHFVSGNADKHPLVDSSGKPNSAVKDSFGKTRVVAPTRQIRIVLLDRFKDEAIVYNLGILPEGEISISGSQASEASTFSVKFEVVEEYKSKKNDGVAARTFIKTALQRFI